MTFEQELRALINRHSKENGCNTPDFILARFLTEVLDAFDQGVQQREKFYKVHCAPGQGQSSKVVVNP